MATTIRADQLRISGNTGLEDDSGSLRVGGTTDGAMVISSTGSLTINTGSTFTVDDVTDTSVTGTPTAGTHIANKTYVDSVAEGLDPKESVQLATTEILDDNTSISGSPTYSNTGGTSGRGQITATLASSDTFTVDGVSLGSADDGTRILIKSEDGTGTGTPLGGEANGIYTTTISGTSLTLDRATDFDEDSEVTAGAFTFVTEGTDNADTGWVLVTDDPITIGGASGTSISFTQFSGVGSFTGGDGIDITGSVISVDLATSPGLEFSSGQLQVISYFDAGADPDKVYVRTDSNGVFLDISGQTGLFQDTDTLRIQKGNQDLNNNLADALDLSTDGVTVLVDNLTVTATSTGQLVSNLVKYPTLVATTADLSATYSNSGGGGSNGQFTSAPTTIDGVSLSTNDRVLVKDQTNTDENGIYRVSSPTSTWERAADFRSTTTAFDGAIVTVQQGSTHADSVWAQTGTISTVGTGSGSAITFAEISGSGLTAGDGIDISGSTISADLLTSGGLKFSSGEIAVEPSDFAGSGLEDDGSDNLRISSAAAGAGIAGGGGSALSLDMYLSRAPASGTIDGVNDTFILDGIPTTLNSDDALMLFVNGVLQEPGGEDYTLSGDEVQFQAGAVPQSGDSILSFYFQ